jgi:5S rRNA maturation endonuclease (ribonuclease M5)
MSSYKALSRTLSKARVDGRFPWHLIKDKTRKSSGQGDETPLDDVLDWASTETRDHLTSLENAFKRIASPKVRFAPSIWDGQPNRVIVTIEKEAVMGAVQNVLEGLDVEIFPLRGYTSTTFMRSIARSIRRLNEYGETYLIIITDYDPSGEDMVRDIQDRLMMDFGVIVNSEKVLLTQHQTKLYNLPPAPAKKSDARYQSFVDQTGSDDVVELDAMSAIEPQAFRQIVRESVTKHFDEDIHDERQFEAKQACEEAEDELRELYTQLEEVHQTVTARIEEIRADQEDG